MSYSYAGYEQDLSQKVAFLYLEAGLTRNEVAGFYGLKRWQIVRMLASVRESGAVQIRLTAKPNHCLDPERRLESRYRLDQAFVVPYPQRPEAVTDIISRVLGGYLSDCIVDGMSIGVGCGRTLTSSLQFMPWKPRSGVAVASLLGGFTRKATFDPFEFALRLGDRCSADTRSLAAPLFAPDRRTRDTLSEFVSGDRSFAGVERFDLAVVSVGDLSPSSTFRTYGLLEADEIGALEACGAVTLTDCRSNRHKQRRTDRRRPGGGARTRPPAISTPNPNVRGWSVRF